MFLTGIYLPKSVLKYFTSRQLRGATIVQAYLYSDAGVLLEEGPLRICWIFSMTNNFSLVSRFIKQLNVKIDKIEFVYMKNDTLRHQMIDMSSRSLSVKSIDLTAFRDLKGENILNVNNRLGNIKFNAIKF